MNNITSTQIVDTYLDHLRQQFVTEPQHDGVQIVTPIWRMDGSPIEVFVYDENEQIRLSDNGQTLAWLFSVGIDLEEHPELRATLFQIAQQQAITIEDGVIEVCAETGSTGAALDRLLTVLNAAAHFVLVRNQSD